MQWVVMGVSPSREAGPGGHTMALFTQLLGRLHQGLAKLRAKKNPKEYGESSGKATFYTGILLKSMVATQSEQR